MKKWVFYGKINMEFLLVVVSSIIFLFSSCASSNKYVIKKADIQDGWFTQSSAKIPMDGKFLSSQNIDTLMWYPAQVPGTVLGSLVKDSVFKNIFFNRNLSKIPDSLFTSPWWYRTSFVLPQLDSNQAINLIFNGINYKADIWLNGNKVASSDSVEGGFRRYTFDVGKYVKEGSNILAVLIYRPGPGDLTLGFVDWNPEPPDHSMGLWRNIQLAVTGPAVLSNTFVQTDVDTVSYDHAAVIISTTVKNYSGKTIKGKLSGNIGDEINISQQVELNPYESKRVVFSPAAYKSLQILHPKLWWVHTLGKPYLYKLHLKLDIEHNVSDSESIPFGIRSVSSYLTPEGFRGFKLNGKKILIEGGGWTDPMFLNASPEYVKANVDYVMQMNLNAIRMEGFWGNNSQVYDLCDKKGILIMAGLSCQWEWTEYLGTAEDEYSAIITSKQNKIAVASLHDQVMWLRNHPSVFTWVYGSDKFPRPSLEARYLSLLKEQDPTRPFVASAAEYNSTLTGPTGVKMRGPYDYVPPVYWYADSLRGGAFGFNTETSPGPEIPVLESLKKMIPADSLWPIGKSWLYHAARHNFYNLTAYNNAMAKRLGAATSLTDYLRKAQFMNYEGMRAMFEAFESNRFKATGIVQWMLNASWPKLWWQLYDYYLMPTAAFYAAEKANEPLHISYNYGNKKVEAINNTLKDVNKLTAVIAMYNFNMQPITQQKIAINTLNGQQAKEIYTLQDSMFKSPVKFLSLALKSENDNTLSNNFYVIPAKKDVINELDSNWYITRQSQYADLSALQKLPDVQLQVQKSFKQSGDSLLLSVSLKNNTPYLAFMVHINLLKKEQSSSVVPIFWNDNYLSVLPGGTAIIKGYCMTKDLEGDDPEIYIDGWNIIPETIK